MKAPDATDPITIAGAGIGGLATAIALARHGLSSLILERREVASEAGAGIQIGPNGMRILQDLGVADRLAPSVGIPQSINVYDARAGTQLTSLPLGDWIASRFGAPYWVAHRRDLHAALLSVANDNDLIEIRNGCAVRSFTTAGDTGSAIEVKCENGAVISAPALIGADGLWSSLRRQIFSDAPLPFLGKIAARAVIPSHELSAPFSNNSVGVWLAPRAHVVHYPLHGNRDVAVVLVTDERTEPYDFYNSDINRDNWELPASSDYLLSQLGAAAPELVSFLHQVPTWKKWALFEPPALAQWCKGRVALLGDAAHPILPFLAQGGVMALEDAITITASLKAHPGDPAAAFAAYEAMRRPRVLRVQQASRRNGKIYHQSGPFAFARNLAMRSMSGERVLAGYDWMYGWRHDS